MYVHRIAFDPAFARFSPGLINTLDAIETAAAEGVTRVEFLGGAERYKIEIADHLEPLYLGFGLAGSLKGKAAVAGRVGGIRVRKRLKRSPGGSPLLLRGVGAGTPPPRPAGMSPASRLLRAEGEGDASPFARLEPPHRRASGRCRAQDPLLPPHLRRPRRAGGQPVPLPRADGLPRIAVLPRRRRARGRRPARPRRSAAEDGRAQLRRRLSWTSRSRRCRCSPSAAFARRSSSRRPSSTGGRASPGTSPSRRCSAGTRSSSSTATAPSASRRTRSLTRTSSPSATRRRSEEIVGSKVALEAQDRPRSRCVFLPFRALRAPRARARRRSRVPRGGLVRARSKFARHRSPGDPASPDRRPRQPARLPGEARWRPRRAASAAIGLSPPTLWSRSGHGQPAPRELSGVELDVGAPERVEGEAPLRALRPASPSRRRSSASASRRPSAAASSSGSPGWTRSPVSPSTTSSGIPPTLEPTTGKPRPWPPAPRLGMPSEALERTKTSASGQQLGYVPSLTEELDVVADPEPAESLTPARLGPGPRRRCGHRVEPGGSSARPRTSVRKSFGAFSRPTAMMTGRSRSRAGRRRRLDVNRVRDHRRALRGARACLETPCAREYSDTQIVTRRQWPHQSIGPVVEGRGRDPNGRRTPSRAR